MQEKQKLWKNYNELGSFAKVAKKMQRSLDTVSHYVHECEVTVHAAGGVLKSK